MICRFKSKVLAAAVLLSIYWLLAVTSVWHKSVTFDEVPHLVGGYSYWLLGDYRLVPECGHLPQRWAAAPLLVSRPAFPSLEQAAWQTADAWAMGRQFFFECGNDVDAMLLPGRMMMALLGVALGALTYLWSRALFGPTAGLLSLALFCFSPAMLAHGALTTSDMSAALFFTAATWSLWRLLHSVTPLNFALLVLTCSGLFLSKFSAAIFIPVGILLAVGRVLHGAPLPMQFGSSWEIRARWRQLSVFTATAGLLIASVALVIWTAFGWRYDAFAANDSARASMYLEQWATGNLTEGLVGQMIGFVREHRLLPEAYIYGVAFIGWTSQSRAAFLNGAFSQVGFAEFFPYCMLVKTPLWLFLLLGIGLFTAMRRCSTKRDEQRRQVNDALYRTAPLWTLLIVYWLFALTSNLNIGERYLLPTYPALFILAGSVFVPMADTSTPRQGKQANWHVSWLVALVALAGYVTEALLTWPHYLSYFNAVAGGSRHGYRHLVDSSLDWGQDLPGLRDWLARNKTAPVYLSYFGTADPAYYGIQAKALPSFMQPWSATLPQPIVAGTYCISATMLQGVYLPLHGSWNDDIERSYRNLDGLMVDYRSNEGDAAALDMLIKKSGFSSWQEVFAGYEQTRFGRLCAFLKKREPDFTIGYSILIYKLTAADVEQALFAPL